MGILESILVVIFASVFAFIISERQRKKDKEKTSTRKIMAERYDNDK